MPKRKFTEADREKAARVLTSSLTSFIKLVETGTTATQNHYGDYRILLNAIQDQGGIETQRSIAEALIRVGANKQGVSDGFKAATGVEL